MALHCDSCGKSLGTYLLGKGGIMEKHHVGVYYQGRLPDIVCNECWDEGYSVENPKHPEKVYSEEYLASHKR